jgi:hypothetical protein
MVEDLIVEVMPAAFANSNLDKGRPAAYNAASILA